MVEAAVDGTVDIAGRAVRQIASRMYVSTTKLEREDGC
jgi:hypothetical protein